MNRTGEDRRSAPRIPIPLPLRFRVSDRRDEWNTRIQDLSEGGLAFSCPYWLNEGTLVSLRFPVREERFELTGAVAHCRDDARSGKFRIGLYFLRPTMGFRLKLADEASAIRELRKSLSQESGVEVGLDEAARQRVEATTARRPDLYASDAGTRIPS